MKERWFIDRVRITVEAGKGGDGLVHFHREKYRPRGGPDGGDGGRGGHVYLVGDPGLKTLLDFKYKHHFKAEDGRPGGPNNRTGRKGRDLLIRVPLGTVVYDDLENRVIGEILKPGQRLLVARGGRGGRGNARFATPTRRAPRIAEPGEPGEVRHLRLELKLLADIGLVGLPNAGKSTLLRALTGAEARVADYPFTTITPNLGLYQDETWRITLVDIPGLIEDAHKGRGMGVDFLRHIERTRGLVFVLDITQNPQEAYKILKREMAAYNPALLEKPRLVVLNKIDLVENPEAVKFQAEPGVPVYRVSALTGEGLEDLKGGLRKWASALRENPETNPGTSLSSS